MSGLCERKKLNCDQLFYVYTSRSFIVYLFIYARKAKFLILWLQMRKSNHGRRVCWLPQPKKLNSTQLFMLMKAINPIVSNFMHVRKPAIKFTLTRK